MKALRWGVAVALVAGLVWLATRDVDAATFLGTLGATDLRWVLLSAWLNLVVYTLLAAGRLQRLMQPLGHARPLPFSHVVGVTLAAAAAHNLLPVPAGEALRTVYLARRYGFALGDVVAAQLVEKVSEAVAVTVEIAVLVLIVPMPGAVRAAGGTFTLIVLVAVVLLLVIAWRGRTPSVSAEGSKGMRKFLQELSRGMHLIGRPQVWLGALVYSALADIVNAVMVGLVLLAVGSPLSPPVWFVVCATTRLTGLLPSTPGQVGVQEAGVVGALGLVGVDARHALAFALMYRAAYWIPTTAVGLWVMRRYDLPATEAASLGARSA